MALEQDGFLSRWSRRKLVARAEPATTTAAAADPATTAAEAPPTATLAATAASGAASEPAARSLPCADPAPDARAPEASAEPATGEAQPPCVAAPPTLEDVAALDADSSYSRFVARDVSPEVRNAAMKKLFTEPQFNVMDGLDIYIDDYGKPDPLPPGMLRQMAQSGLLGLFAAEDAADAEKARLAALTDQAAADPAGPPQPATEALEETPADAGIPLAEPGAAAAEPPATTRLATAPAPAPDEDTDLQLQPVHGLGHPGAAPGTEQDPGRER